MIQLNVEYTFITYGGNEFIFVFTEEKENSYILEWEDIDDGETGETLWNKGSIRNSLQKDRLKVRMTETEKQIAKNYEI